MNEKAYSVSEAVRLIGVESHVLRYWEEELQIEIQRNSQGHRLYSEENIRTFQRVKELKETGLQLKAIRLLLWENNQDGPEGEVIKELREIEQCARQEKSCSPGEEIAESFDIISIEDKPDNLKQFEMILKRMIEEVVEEQNEKLEQAIAEMLKDELEELCCRYFGLQAQEAAASREMERKHIRLRDFLKHYFTKRK